MRQIGTLSSQPLAIRFTDYLLTQGIHSKADPSRDGECTIWIHEENQVDQARTELEAFRSNPDDPRYQNAAEEASGIRKMEQLRERERRKNVREVKPRGGPIRAGLSAAPVTRSIIAICVVVVLLGKFFPNDIGNFIYDNFSFMSLEDQQIYRVSPDPNSLRTIERGQIWRLFTPALLHARVGNMFILHIGFNMYMLYMLGPILEQRLGSIHFLILNLGLALFSNLAQGVIPMLLYDTPFEQFEKFYGSPFFLGYSGVLYGLFGYLWVRSNNDPTFGIMMAQSSIMILMVWFFLCWIGFMGNVANLAHTGGLVAGIVIGYITAMSRQ